MKFSLLVKFNTERYDRIEQDKIKPLIKGILSFKIGFPKGELWNS
jgi:hypothetical protein